MTLTKVSDRQYELPATGEAAFWFWQRFSDAAQLHPQLTAVNFPQRDATIRLSYAELAQRAGICADALHRHGVSRGMVVAIVLSRSPALSVALLSVLATKAVFVMIDPAQPELVLRRMLETAKPKAIIQQSDSAASGYTNGSGVVMHIATDGRLEQIAGHVNERPAGFALPEDALYLIFTSGTTGKPKALIGSGSGTANRLLWAEQHHPLDGSDIACARSNTSFVDSICEQLAPLLSGVPLMQLSALIANDPTRLAHAICEQRITRLLVVPTVLANLLDEAEPAQLASLRMVISSGEALSGRLASTLFKTVPECVLLNLYGSSEVSGDVTAMVLTAGNLPATIDRQNFRTYEQPIRCDAEKWLSVPIGKPIDGVSLLIVDDQSRCVSTGVTGELIVQGKALACGYLDQSGKKFSQGFVKVQGTASFATGDLGFRDADDCLHYIARKDDQLNVRGVRIASAEVIHALLALPGTDTAHIMASPDSQQLWAAIGGSEYAGDTGRQQQVLRRSLRERLPAHLVPDRICCMNRLPVGPTGKMDTQSLLRLFTSDITGSVENSAHDESALLPAMLKLWQQLLPGVAITADDDFFAVGGHSLMAIRLFSRIEKSFGIALPLVLIFESSTVRALCKEIEKQLDKQKPHESLMILREQGRYPALFLVPPIARTGLYFQQLSVSLSPDQPLYAFDMMLAANHESVEKLAEVFCEHLLSVQPLGPYCLFAACQGGVVAHEIGQQLLASGKGKVTIFLLDSYPPLFGPWPDSALSVPVDAGRWRYYCRRALTLLQDGSTKKVLLRKWRYIVSRFDSELKRYFDVFEHHQAFSRRYRARAAAVDLVLLFSEEHTRKHDAVQHWRQLTTRNFDLRTFSGAWHYQITDENSVHWPRVAALINEYSSASNVKALRADELHSHMGIDDIQNQQESRDLL